MSDKKIGQPEYTERRSDAGQATEKCSRRKNRQRDRTILSRCIKRKQECIAHREDKFIEGKTAELAKAKSVITRKYTVQRQITQRFFHRRTRQTEPLLQKVLVRLVCVCAYVTGSGLD